MRGGAFPGTVARWSRALVAIVVRFALQYGTWFPCLLRSRYDSAARE